MNLFYCLCEDLLEVGSLAKGVGCLGSQGSYRCPGNLHEMGTGWAGMGGDSTKSVWPVHLVDGYG